MLADAENYVSMDLNYGTNRMNVIIQRVAPGKMSPHEKAEMYKKKYEELLNNAGENK
jgi:aromatic ring-cleaving dioxygenase